MRRLFLIVQITLITVSALAQIGGKSAFNSLKVPTYTKASALGGYVIANPDENVNYFTSNPALLKDVDQHISFQHTFHMADIQYSQINYAHEIKKIGLVGFGLQYFNYGTFDAFDVNGVSNGEFRATDFIFTGSYSHQTGSFRFGTNLKLAFSDIQNYNASAILFDVGGIYQHPTSNLTVGLLIKNAGFVARDYTDENHSTLPFDVQIGTTFKPEHMPFRFSLNIHDLISGNITYYDPHDISKQDNSEPTTVDKILRHIAIGAELLFSEHFQLLVGYNHLVRQELKLENASGGAGLSYGLQIKIKTFDLAYSRCHYAAGKASNQIGLLLNFKDFTHKGI